MVSKALIGLAAINPSKTIILGCLTVPAYHWQPVSMVNTDPLQTQLYIFRIGGILVGSFKPSKKYESIHQPFALHGTTLARLSRTN